MTKTTLDTTDIKDINDIKTIGISLEESLDDILDTIESVPSKFEKWYYITEENEKFFYFTINLYDKLKSNICEKYRTDWEFHGMNTSLFYNSEKTVYNTLYKVTKHVIITVERNYLPVCHLCFSPHLNNTIELNEISVIPSCRGMGVGTQIMEDIISCVLETETKLYVFPGVTTNEIGRNGTSPEEQIPKLKRWYCDMGFVKCLPEFTQLTKLKTGKVETLGISGYYVIS